MPLIGKEQYTPAPFKVIDQDEYILLPLEANMALGDLVHNMLDQEDYANIENTVKKYWQYPPFRGVYADYLLEQGYTEVGIDILKESLEDFPENLTLMCILSIVYLDLGEINEAELLMRKWIDYESIDPNQEVYINTFELLVTFLASYFAELKDDENLEVVYRWTLADQYENICMGLSFKLMEQEMMIRQQEESDFFDLLDEEYDDDEDDELIEGLDYFMGSDDDDFFDDDDDFYDDDDYDDLNYNLEYYEALEVNDQPYHVVFKDLLELKAEKIPGDILLNIDRLAADPQLVHDVQWLVKNALLEVLQGDEVDVHQIWHAMMITGAKDLTECVPLFLEIYQIGEGATEYIFDDEEYFFFAQYLGHLLDRHQHGVDRMLRQVNMDWFHKSTFFRIIAKKASEGNEVYNEDYIKTLAAYYSKLDDVDAITWLRQACMDYQPIGDLEEFFLSKPYIDQIDEMVFDPYDYEVNENIKLIETFNTVGEAQDLYLDHFLNYLLPNNPYTSQFTSEAMMDDEYDERSESPIWQLVRSNAIMAIGDIFNENQNIDPFDSTEGDFEDVLNTTMSPIKYDECPCGSGKDYDQCCLNMN